MKSSELKAISKMYKRIGLDPKQITNDEQANILTITAISDATSIIEYDNGITYERIVVIGR